MKHSITGEIELADDYAINIDKLFEEALKEVYSEATVEEARRALSPSLFKLTNDPLQHAVESTFSEPQFGKPEPDFLNEFKYNTGVFSAFKAHAEQELLVSMLLDEEGNLRSFHKFRKATKQVGIRWNEHWLRTEYNTAVRSARAAANYCDALRSKEMYPNLEYLMSNAQDKRESHLELVGTIRPIEDPFWDTYLPPSDWNCACSVTPTDKPVTDLPTIVSEVPPVFRNNPGKTAEIVKLDEHPYLKGKGLPTCPECRRQGLTIDTELIDYEDLLCPMHRAAWNALQDDWKKQRKLADKLVKEWAEEAIPYNGLTFNGNTFLTGKVRVWRKSIKDLSGHIAHAKQKLLVMKIDEILKECTYKRNAPLVKSSHNLKKKKKRGAVGFAYYEFEVEGDLYQLDMEIREQGFETPYSIRRIKKKSS